MSIALPYRFMLAAILFVTIGMVLGLYMGPAQDPTLVPVHVHLNLLGWATMMLFGLYYRGMRSLPEAPSRAGISGSLSSA